MATIPPPCIPLYLASGRPRAGASGFVNFDPGPAGQVMFTLAKVFQDHPTAAVLDGEDNWNAPVWQRPEVFIYEHGLTPIAWFHSGPSGLARSGAVIPVHRLPTLAAWYAERHQRPLDRSVAVFTPDLHVVGPVEVQAGVARRPVLVAVSAAGLLLRGGVNAEHPLSAAERAVAGQALAALGEHTSGTLAVTPGKRRHRVHAAGFRLDLDPVVALELGRALLNTSVRLYV